QRVPERLPAALGLFGQSVVRKHPAGDGCSGAEAQDPGDREPDAGEPEPGPDEQRDSEPTERADELVEGMAGRGAFKHSQIRFEAVEVAAEGSDQAPSGAADVTLER